MHAAALAELGLAAEWTYEAIDVAPDELRGAGPERWPRQGFVGANVTVPHKGAALTVADNPSETAREIGAANTLSFVEGEVNADNTDAPGLLDALPEPPDGLRALVLGAGGAARAVVWALVREGAEVEVWNRTALRSENLCEELGRPPGRRARPGRLRADRQRDRGRPPRRADLRGAAAPRRRLRAPARPSSTWSTPKGRPNCSRRPPRAGRPSSTGSRSSSARESTRCGSGPAASPRRGDAGRRPRLIRAPPAYSLGLR